MKRIISTLMILCLIFSAAACSTSQPDEDEKTYDRAPVIVINGNEYFADIASIVNELPDGYEYGGKLTEEQIKYAYINGTAVSYTHLLQMTSDNGTIQITAYIK